MRILNKIYLLIFSLSLMIPFTLSAYQWPLSPFSGPHPINATLGEFRVPSGNLSYHFHSGVDIKSSNGTNVYSIVTNTISELSKKNHLMKIGNYRYVHIVPDSDLTVGDRVIAFQTVIGTIQDLPPTGSPSGDHLHFEEYSGSTKLNPLASLDNYADNSNPTVWKPDFWHQSYDASGNATNISIPKSGLWGKIDVRARAKDAQSKGSSTVGMYKMGYAVQDKAGNIYLYDENIVFNKIVGKIENGIEYIYDKPNCNNSLYYYWLTNKFIYTTNNAEDRYWNTKLKKGEPWNGDTARINKEAKFPDGKYTITVRAFDYSNHKDSKTKDVILDNFVPYLDSVVVTAQREEGGVVVYRGWWDNSLNFHSQSEGPAYKNDELTFTLFFSEEMAPDRIDVKLRRGGSSWDIEPIGWSKTRYSNDTWKGSFSVPDEEEAVGVDTLVVGGRDVAENKLDSIPSSVAYRDNAGNWQNYEGGKDINHSFEIVPYPIVLSTIPANSANGVPVNTKITFVFSHPMDTVSVRENLSISPSFTGGAYYEWSDNSEILRVIPADTMIDLLYDTDYTVSLSGNAKDKWGYTLDGNENGEMEGSPTDDYTITFRTNKVGLFIITEPVEGFNVYVGKGPGTDRKRHKIYILNFNGRKKTVTLDVTQKKPPPDSIYPYIGWEQPTQRVFEMKPFGVDTTQLWVQSSWSGMDTVPDNVSALVLGLFVYSNIPGDTFRWFAVTYPEFPPRVKWVYPPDSARNVSLDDTIIKIRFTRSMDWGEDNVNDIYVQVSPPIKGQDKIVKGRYYIIIKGDTLKKCTDYNITVHDMLTDRKGHRLDGDKNGIEGRNFNSVFFTEDNSVKVWAEPMVGRVKKDSAITHTVHIENQINEDVNGYIEIDGGGPGWATSPTLPIISDFTIPSKEEKKYSYKAVNNGAVSPLDVIYRVSTCRDLYGEGYYWNAEEHIRDHPDESYKVADENFPTPWYIDTKSDIGILLSGWGDALGHIVGKYGIKTAPVKPDFRILNDFDRRLNDLKVLLIGSAGLIGMNSPTFKSKLADFVRNGGTIIAFTQQHGNEFSALPVPEGESLSGYGWSEDQSCHNKSVYLDEWHPVLSGQHRLTPDMNVDGWFKKWPKDAKLLFKRTASGMPAIVMYPYGNGWVVVTSLYSDWSYGHSQRTAEEVSLVRDLVTWAIDTKDSIPEYYEGDSISSEFRVPSQMRKKQKKW